jgi:hypothetical protein
MGKLTVARLLGEPEGGSIIQKEYAMTIAGARHRQCKARTRAPTGWKAADGAERLKTSSCKMLFVKRRQDLLLIFDDGVQAALILQNGGLILLYGFLIGFNLFLIGENLFLIGENPPLIRDDMPL